VPCFEEGLGQRTDRKSKEPQTGLCTAELYKYYDGAVAGENTEQLDLTEEQTVNAAIESKRH
jgi:hypothetical protein